MNQHFKNAYASMQRGYKHNTKNGVEYITIPQFDACSVIVHAFSTRKGGVSESPHNSLNLSLVRPASHQGVSENYARITSALAIPPENLVLLNYVHGDDIEIVDCSYRGMGFARETKLRTCDAMITNEPGIVFVTIHADCTSFMIYDPVKHVIAACHAGWKGTLLRIGQKTIEKMSSIFGTNPANCFVGIGPCICANCFEVDLPVAEQFAPEFPDIDIIQTRDDGKYLVDLVQCAAKQFWDAGVLAKNITIADECTYEKIDCYFSYRRDHLNAGSMAGFLGLL